MLISNTGLKQLGLIGINGFESMKLVSISLVSMQWITSFIIFYGFTRKLVDNLQKGEISFKFDLIMLSTFHSWIHDLNLPFFSFDCFRMREALFFFKRSLILFYGHKCNFPTGVLKYSYITAEIPFEEKRID